MNDAKRYGRAEEVCYVVLRALAWIMNPLYHFDLVSIPVGVSIAAILFGLLAASGVLAWRSSRYELAPKRS